MNAELPSLIQVRAFARVAELGSISRACEALFRAQSVVTRAISDLEKRLGAVLFERRANGMLLTEHGKRVLPRAQRALGELARVPQLAGGAERPSTEPSYLFNTRRLEIFVRLCAARHMQSVALHFGLTQPAISSALKIIEQGCGQRLFERTSRGLQPTLVAEDILVPIKRALNELRHMDDDLAAMRGTLQGLVTVGALPLCRTRILPQAIVQLVEAHPQVQIATQESPFEWLAGELRAGDVDFILGALRPSEYASDLLGEALLTEEMVVLARRGHPLLGEGVSLNDLATARWILPRAATPARHLLEDYFEEIGLQPPQPVVETGDLAVIRGLLLGSSMLAVVSAHQLELEIQSGELQRLPLQLRHTTRAIGLTHRANGLPSPAAQALMDEVRRVAAQMGQFLPATE